MKVYCFNVDDDTWGEYCDYGRNLTHRRRIQYLLVRPVQLLLCRVFGCKVDWQEDVCPEDGPQPLYGWCSRCGKFYE